MLDKLETFFDVVLVLLVPIILILVGYLMTLGVYQMSQMDKCLEQGYPDTKVTLTFNVYCTGIDGNTHSSVHKL